jgi:hypothetical protein
MSQPQVKWGVLERYLIRRNFVITSSGGDKIVIAPIGYPGERRTVRIGHTSCGRPGFQVKPVYLSQIKNRWGITIDDILAE